MLDHLMGGVNWGLAVVGFIGVAGAGVALVLVIVATIVDLAEAAQNRRELKHRAELRNRGL